MSTTTEQRTDPLFGTGLDRTEGQQAKSTAPPPPGTGIPRRDYTRAIGPAVLLLGVVGAFVFLLRRTRKPSAGFRGISPAAVARLAVAAVATVATVLYPLNGVHWREMAKALLR